MNHPQAGLLWGGRSGSVSDHGRALENPLEWADPSDIS